MRIGKYVIDNMTALAIGENLLWMGVALWMNYDWYKHCNRINDDWARKCEEINNDWAKRCEEHDKAWEKKLIDVVNGKAQAAHVYPFNLKQFEESVRNKENERFEKIIQEALDKALNGEMK